MVFVPLEKAKEHFQRQYVLEVPERNNGNRTQTARDLGVDPRTIFRYLDQEIGLEMLRIPLSAGTRKSTRVEWISIAASTLRSMATSAARRPLNTTSPLESKVFTSPNPAASSASFSSGIFRFTGLTPRRNAA